MTSGFGVDPAEDGSSGTSSSDIRKIYGALYKPGLISGCEVTRSATSMEYTVSTGVVAINVGVTTPGQEEVILAPVQQTTVPTSPAPITGDRVDIIYAQQRYPDIEGDANVVIGVGTTLPERAVEIRRYRVSAGQTNTNAAVLAANLNFSIPYGATLGVLHYEQLGFGLNSVAPQFQRLSFGSFNLPTDRMLRFKVFAVMSAQGASGFDNSKYCEYGFIPNFNNGDFILWQTGGLHQAWQSYYFETTKGVPAGPVTVNLLMTKIVGPGTPLIHNGLGGDGYGRRGVEFTVEDAGPII